jgi:CRISPR/Cas system-associated endonuclease Cas1
MLPRGFLHVDSPSRDSLVYDLMECQRGAADGFVLDFVGCTKLHYGDVTPISDGSCRPHPQMARAAVATCRVQPERLREHATRMREYLADSPVRSPHTL